MRYPLLLLAEAISFLVAVSGIWPYQVAYGYLYGVGLGWAAGVLGFTVACIPPFLLAPSLAGPSAAILDQLRSASGALLPAGVCPRRLDALDGLHVALREQPFLIVLCLRLNPIVPSGLCSYALGLSGAHVPLASYLAGSTLGSMANVLAYTYCLLYTSPSPRDS